MTLKPPLTLVPGLGVRITARLRELRMTQLELAKRAGISRQTVTTAISNDRITQPVADRLAEVLDIPGAQLMGEAATPAGGVRESDAKYGTTAPRTHPQRVRVWLADFRAELTRAGATDDEITEAMDLVQAPQLFVFYAGGKPREMTEEQMLTGLDALATVIRKELRKRGRKFV